MSKAMRIYWSHVPNLVYAAMFLTGLSYILMTGALLAHWYIVLLLIALIPFIEYFAHKYFLHMPQPKHPEKHPIWDYIANRTHYLHHQDPKKVEHIFAEPWLVLLAVGLDFGLAWLVTWDLTPTIVFMTAGVAYFMLYEWTHFIAHYDGYTPNNAYGRFIKKYHLWHHYKNEDYWFGVTNPFADWIFGKWKDPHAVPASGMALSNRKRRATKH